jgi:hypothetical protein
MEIPPVQRFVIGFQNGAKWMKADTKTLNVYIPSFTDPAKGKETGQSMIAQGCDVVFGVGGNTGDGGLLAATEKGLMAIGVDVDQYNTYPEVKDALLSSAAKNADVAIYDYLKSVKDGSVKAGIMMANLGNGGVGLAPYHDWDSKIPQAVKDKYSKERVQFGSPIARHQGVKGVRHGLGDSRFKIRLAERRRLLVVDELECKSRNFWRRNNDRFQRMVQRHQLGAPGTVHLQLRRIVLLGNGCGKQHIVGDFCAGREPVVHNHIEVELLQPLIYAFGVALGYQWIARHAYQCLYRIGLTGYHRFIDAGGVGKTVINTVWCTLF